VEEQYRWPGQDQRGEAEPPVGDGAARTAFAGMAQGFPDETAPVFVISVAAQLAGMHPQTLRQYDRLGLVSPGRTPGGGRRYSARDVVMLREVSRLTQEEGVNLAGVKRIIELTAQVAELRARVQQLARELAVARQEAAAAAAAVHASYRRDLVPVRSSALVIWQPQRRDSG
jgi:MerR family transcriptional regulator, heat shock protein HspR